jgi:hypothetical protein
MESPHPCAGMEAGLGRPEGGLNFGPEARAEAQHLARWRSGGRNAAAPKGPARRARCAGTKWWGPASAGGNDFVSAVRSASFRQPLQWRDSQARRFMETRPLSTSGGIDGNLGFPPSITRERRHPCRRPIRLSPLESTKKAAAKNVWRPPFERAVFTCPPPPRAGAGRECSARR